MSSPSAVTCSGDEAPPERSTAQSKVRGPAGRQYTPEELQDEVQQDPSFRLDLGDPTREEAGELTDGLDRCWGFFEKTRDQALARAEDNPNATPELLSCARESLDDEFLRSVMIDDFMRDGEPATATSERVETLCGHLVQ